MQASGAPKDTLLSWSGQEKKGRSHPDLNQRPIGLQPIALPLSYSSRVNTKPALSGICVVYELQVPDSLCLSADPQHQKLPAIHQAGPASEKLNVGSNSGSNARRRKVDLAACFWTQNSSACRFESYGSHMPRLLAVLILVEANKADERFISLRVRGRAPGDLPPEDSQVEVITSNGIMQKGLCFAIRLPKLLPSQGSFV